MTYLYAIFVLPILVFVGVVDFIFRLVLGGDSE